MQWLHRSLRLSRVGHACSICTNMRRRRCGKQLRAAMRHWKFETKHQATAEFKRLRRVCTSLLIVETSCRRGRLLRAWGRWRGVVRWCHSIWMQRKLRAGRLEHALSVVSNVLRRGRGKQLKASLHRWKINVDYSSSEKRAVDCHRLRNAWRSWSSRVKQQMKIRPAPVFSLILTCPGKAKQEKCVACFIFAGL